MKKFCIIVMALIIGICHAQKWGVVNNINHIFDIDEHAGELYISTWGGVGILDAASAPEFSEMQVMQHYSTSNSLVSNDIRNLAISDIENDIWMGSYDDGISVVRKGDMVTLGANMAMPFQQVRKIFDYGEYVYVATDRGLCVFYTLDEVSFPLMLRHYTATTTAGGLSDNNLNDMLLTPDNMLYLSHDLGFSYAHIDSLSFFDAWKSHNVMTGHKNIIFAANEEGMAICYTKQGKVYHKRHTQPDDGWSLLPISVQNLNHHIASMYLDDNNDLWLGFGKWDEDSMRYERGGTHILSRYNIISREQENWEARDNGIGAKVISKIKRLDSGLYFGSWGDGLARYENGEFEYYYNNSIAFQKVSQIIEDREGKFWFNSGVIGDIDVRKGTMGVCSFDGEMWEAFDTDNSRLHSDNILGIGVDSKNRKWFGAWDTSYANTGNHNGLTIYDDSDGSWIYQTKFGRSYWDDDLGTWSTTDWIADSPRIITNTIAGIYKDQNDYIHVLCYDGGVSIFDTEDNIVRSITLPNSINNRVTVAYHNGRQYFYGTEYDKGLFIWNDESLPESEGTHWVTRMPPDLNSGKIYGIESVDAPYGGRQHFIASGGGLYMWDEVYWYRYDPYIKRMRFNFSNNTWENDILYYEDEERIFGSVSTYPISIMKDPFQRLWIGSDDHGMSMYDLRRERFVNYFVDNSPLISNTVNAFAYDAKTGNLLIGTPDGMNTFKIGMTEKPEVPLKALRIFPNPFLPEGSNILKITNSPDDAMPKGKNICRIYDSNGTLITELKETILADFEWDGKNESGKIVSSGVYFVVVSNENGESRKGKFAVIR